jgi:sensor c-di-GMP phosphodiesterase-like protein
MERARSANLQVVASGVDDIRDFAWMRAHGQLLYCGAAMSASLSPECLDAWLQADSSQWRSFNACTTRFLG